MKDKENSYIGIFDKLDEKHIVKWYQLIIPKLFGTWHLGMDIGEEWIYYTQTVKYRDTVYVIKTWKERALYFTSTNKNNER